jgi:hypothetical protein
LVTNIISQERLTKYMTAAGGDAEFALELYGWNIQISEAFFPVLSAVEVCLRNTVSARLIKKYGYKWWNDTQFHSLIGRKGKGIALTSSERLSRRGVVTSGGMVAELTFGFWVQMLRPKNEATLWTPLHAFFPDLPATISYEQFYDRCDEVSKFRNRIFHHEPIIERDVLKEHREILETIKWISSDKGTWIQKYSRVGAVARTKPRRKTIPRTRVDR